MIKMVYKCCRNYYLQTVHHTILTTLLCRKDSSASTLWNGPFIIEGVLGHVILVACILKIPISNANNVNPDQTAYSVASDLGLHCLPMSFL